jgi:hypothetical protein
MSLRKVGLGALLQPLSTSFCRSRWIHSCDTPRRCCCHACVQVQHLWPESLQDGAVAGQLCAERQANWNLHATRHDVPGSAIRTQRFESR